MIKALPEALPEALNAELAARGFRLESFEARLVLRDLENPKTSPLEVDFVSPKMRYRLAHGLSKNQPLAKAVGIKSRTSAPSVFDATAGLGVDAFCLAALGCRVEAVEKSPVVFALLEDGYRRLGEVADFIAVHERLVFRFGSAIEHLARVNPDVVYLDPMYPVEEHESSALPKKSMQMFRRLLADGESLAAQDEALLQAALNAAKNRVVVKRPVNGKYLGAAKPTHSFGGKTARFDLYLV